MMDNIKHLIEAEVRAMLKDIHTAAPAEKVALARAINALAASISELSSGSAATGLRELLQTLDKKD